jgi:hypothetical protein
VNFVRCFLEHLAGATMYKAQIRIGDDYALREKSGELQRVRIVAHMRGGKWKAEWIEPDAGLVHYVESANLVAPWKERAAFLREEQQRRVLREHNQRAGYSKDSPLERALGEVFESTGEAVTFWHGALSAAPDVLARVRARAGISDGTLSPFGYTGRDGQVYVPYDDSAQLAQRFCAAEPTTVLLHIESTEREWSSDVQYHRESYLVKLLNEYRAAWALIRQWAGLDAAVALRERRIQELERLVWDAIYALQKAGDDRAAAKLRDAVQTTRR